MEPDPRGMEGAWLLHRHPLPPQDVLPYLSTKTTFKGIQYILAH